MLKGHGKTKKAQSRNRTNIQVVVRCRPMNLIEIKRGHQNIIDVDCSRKSLRIRRFTGETRFTFDAVYDSETTQKQIYEQSVRPMINELIKGFNVTILAYGQTGTGKTFTMEGKRHTREIGIMQRAFKQIFDYKNREHYRRECSIQCSYFELYQNKMIDLLDPGSSSDCNLGTKGWQMQYKELCAVQCASAQDMERCLREGFKSRKTAETYYNEYSSRSHAVFSVTMSIYRRKTGKRECCSKLSLVDLAGSECLQKSNACDIRLKECCEINLSLLALNRVISSSVSGKKHIPYRDSTLTKILRDSIGGNAKTLIIANISPVDNYYNETMVTLEYANRAKMIKNSPMMKFTSYSDQDLRSSGCKHHGLYCYDKVQEDIKDSEEKENREHKKKLVKVMIRTLSSAAKLLVEQDETNEAKHKANIGDQTF